MKMRLLASIGLFAASLAGLASDANAAVVRYDIELSGSNFTPLFGPGGVTPVDPIFLNARITLNTSLNYISATDGLVIQSFNAPYQLRFSYSGAYLVLATAPLIGGCQNSADSFCASIFDPFSGTPSVLWLQQQTSDNTYWDAADRSVRMTAVVPEPGSWVLMIAGFGLTGAAMRHRHRVVAA